MAKKIESKIEKIEREYVIPLREKCRTVPRYKKPNKAVKTIKEFLVRHMKLRDRDLRQIKIDNYLNEALWQRGIRKPPHKIRVKAIKEGDIVRVELVDFPERLKFKKAKEDKMIKEVTEAIKKKKAKKAEEAAKAKESEAGKTEEEKKEEVEKKTIEKEKVASGAEVAKELGKVAAKVQKRTKQPSMKQPKHQQRKALAK